MLFVRHVPRCCGERWVTRAGISALLSLNAAIYLVTLECIWFLVLVLTLETRSRKPRVLLIFLNSLAPQCDKGARREIKRSSTAVEHASQCSLHVGGGLSWIFLHSGNAALAAKAEVLGDRLAALHARTSSGSCVARCLCAWRGETARIKVERLKNATAGDHAR